jgi:hypothetical protein
MPKAQQTGGRHRPTGCPASSRGNRVNEQFIGFLAFALAIMAGMVSCAKRSREAESAIAPGAVLMVAKMSTSISTLYV